MELALAPNRNHDENQQLWLKTCSEQARSLCTSMD